jgi:antitoxin component YwqK of YwqJK toxin-antitoxin module
MIWFGSFKKLEHNQARSGIGKLVMRTTRSAPSNLRLLGLVLCGLVLSACSQNSEISQEPEVFTRPVLIRDGITYHQDTNEPVTGVVEEFNDDSLLEQRTTYRDGEEVNRTRFTYWLNGQLMMRDNYIDGERDGLIEVFHENGQLHIRENYKDGKLNGPHEFFSESGLLVAIRNYTDGVIDNGLVETLHDNGQLSCTENYMDGKPEGVFRCFDEDGNLTETRAYRNGELVETNLNP